MFLLPYYSARQQLDGHSSHPPIWQIDWAMQVQYSTYYRAIAIGHFDSENSLQFAGFIQLSCLCQYRTYA